MFSDLAIKKVLSLPKVNTILDIGCGEALQAYHFADAGKKVHAVDIMRHPSFKQHRNINFYQADFMGKFYVHPVDCAWLSHILEHQLNVNQFLTKVLRMVRPGGYIAITVPPAKDAIVGGHVTLWNAGLVLYNMILAGTSAKTAMIKSYGYNTSVVVQYEPIVLPTLKYDYGDIEALSEHFPTGLGIQGFNGRIKELNW